MKMPNEGWPRVALLGAAGISLATALVHLAMTLFPELSPYFGAPEWLLSDRTLLLALGSGLTVVFLLFAAYAWAGADPRHRLPALRTGLLVIAGIYLLRGSALLEELPANMGLIYESHRYPPREILVSAVALLAGVLYLLGTSGKWEQLSSNEG